MEFEQEMTGGITVESHYLRQRNALLLTGQFSQLYMDYYLHLMQHGLRYEVLHDDMLKEALAAMTLHLASRPVDESTAWTIHRRAPRMNLFVTGDNRTRKVTGRVFTEDVKESEHDLFFAQTVRGTAPARQSVVAVESHSVMRSVEEFYARSQQLKARFFGEADPERYRFLVAMPDCDLEWMEMVDMDQAPQLVAMEENRLLEVREYHFGCDCTLERIVRAISALQGESLDELFGEDTHLVITCPRCGAGYQTTRDDLQNFQDS